ncbi:uncharacterized protein LOC126737650 [Anthonomus grandis grandis]|uniref:uncharacterized protein LOC126737650 n=1 Tax=Anthonomus grandis grandis TaxID=2921223 RepID=UPI002165D23E|nr:uncharacterized protein LOC126737650 [Anthonomus grandis grandis]
MRPYLLISAFVVIAIANAQLLPNFVPAFPDNPLDGKPWTGPIADHKLGVHPSDTPEVAAAKAQHFNVYNAVLKTLPILPPEETKVNVNIPVPIPTAHIPQHLIPVVPEYQPQVHHPQPLAFPTPSSLFRIPESINKKIDVFAEEIPRSEFGEVPEVAAARATHLKAFEEAKRIAAKPIEHLVQPQNHR